MDLDPNSGNDILSDNDPNKQEQYQEHHSPAPATRSSARVRANREKNPTTQRSATVQEKEKGKGKGNLPAASPTRRSNGGGITINEPVHDPKGKKRALPLHSDHEDPLPSPKRVRRTSSPTKGKAGKQNKTNSSKNMSKRTRTKGKKISEPGPSNEDQLDEDVDMLENSDADEAVDLDLEEPIDPDGPKREGDGVAPCADASTSTSALAAAIEVTTSEPTGDMPSTSAETAAVDSAAPADPSPPTIEQPPPQISPQEQSFSASLAMMGNDFHLGAYMASLAPRLRTILQNLKPGGAPDPAVRLMALQDLSEILSMSTEDNLSGYFSVDSYVKELVHIMGGPRQNDEDDGDRGDGDGDDGDGDGDNDDAGERGDDTEDNVTPAKPVENAESNVPAGETSANSSEVTAIVVEDTAMVSLPQDEDAALAAALAMSSGGAGGLGEDNLEEQLLACRCLANLMEAMPGSAHTLVYHGAVPVLCGKLMEIQFIDLAEQTISTLEKLSEEYPSAIVREGGLAALLNYLDFFSTHVQRTALQAAANCCRNMSSDSFSMIRDVWPTIRTVLSYSDQRLVEHACMCVIRTIESFSRHQTESLETLIDVNLVRAMNMLLMPPSGTTPIVSPNTSTLCMRALASGAKASPKITIALLEAGIADTLYTFLTGVPPSATSNALPSSVITGEGQIEGNGERNNDQGGVEGGQGFGGGLADMVVMQNLAHRPKDQVEEALSLICEIMPPLPRDGVFDPKGYTEKAVARAIKAKLKEAKQSKASQAVSTSVAGVDDSATSTAEATSTCATTPAPSILASVSYNEQVQLTETNPIITDPPQDNITQTNSEAPVAPQTETTDAEATVASSTTILHEDPLPMAPIDGEPDVPPEPSNNEPSTSTGKSRRDAAQARLQLLRDKTLLISRFLYLIIPVLFDVYSASVTLQVRMRSFTGILKATSFVDEGDMGDLFMNVPVASFVGSILTSRDNPYLVTNALQLVELLLIKSPAVFRNSLRKEGILHEISTIAKIDLKSKPKPTPVPVPTTELEPPPASPTETGGTAEVTAENPNANAESTTVVATPPPVPVPAQSKKSSSIPTDPQDAYVLRSRLIKVKYMSGSSDSSGDPVFDALKSLIKELGTIEAKVEQLKSTLKEIAKLFVNGPQMTISSFELLKSGLVDGLLEFATDPSRKVDIQTREELLLDAFSLRSGYSTPSSQTPLSVLVKRLQESLARMETFDVITTSPGSLDDAKRTSVALISRTLRLRLVAEDPSDVPKSCQNMMVSIHAIAPWSALDDYLMPRIAGIMTFRPDLSSGLLQALTNSSGNMPSSLAQSVLARLASNRPVGSINIGAGGGSSGNPVATANALATLLNALNSPPEAGASGLNGSNGTATGATGAGGSGSATPGATSSTSNVVAPPSSTAEQSSISRRRSLRLRGQPPDSDPSAQDAATTSETTTTLSAPSDAEASTSLSATAAAANALAADLLEQLEDDGLDDDDDDPIDGDGGDNDDGAAGRTFNLIIDAVNGDVTASTPGGTRVPTPLPGTSTILGDPLSNASSSAATSSSQPRLSYASAAMTAIDKATDFHLEFRLNDEVLPMDMTVYGALHQLEWRRSDDKQPNPHAVWNGNYTIKYRKIPGKRPTPEQPKEEAMETDIIAGLAADSPASKILRLLRVLHRLNAEGIEHIDSNVKIVTIPESAFVNNKLTAKLARQLEEIMILASNCLPDWALDLPQSFGFLFPFSSRYLFFQSTSFGYARLLNRVIFQTTRENNNNNRRDGIDQYGRLQRRKIEVPRDKPIEAAFKMFDLFGTSSAVLDVHFHGEVGTGLGPTLEFFASVCRGFAWRKLKIWRDADSTLPGEYVHHPLGLFPAPILNEIVEGPEATEGDKRRVRLFKLLGQFIARALLDSRVIDISFNKIFLKLILDEHVPLAVTSIKIVDPAIGQSLSTLQKFIAAKKVIEADGKLSRIQKTKSINKLKVNDVKIEDLCLDFTVPGYEDMELKPGGRDITVTVANVEEYIQLTIDAIIGRGVRPASKAFKEGFSTVFPVNDLKTFSVDELVMMFGNADEDWSIETLNEAIKADHGFNVESKAIRDLIDIMTSYDVAGRRDFLQFITGSPKLPIGGFRTLNPLLTVVRKPHEAPLTPDDYLPSVMTCAHYLKLPDYSSREVMAQKLLVAMREGIGSFHLS